jgi:hypothetical protein
VPLLVASSSHRPFSHRTLLRSQAYLSKLGCFLLHCNSRLCYRSLLRKTLLPGGNRGSWCAAWFCE